MKVTTVRFNLKFFNANGEEEVVRTLDDLRDKFNICDLWNYFRSGDLVQWLKSINELQLAETVEFLNGIADKQTVLSKLCETLRLAVTNDEILELCEILDRQELVRESHKKVENVREQMNSGSAPEMEICESISGFENTYYIDNFNLIMKELDKFKSDDDYRNIEKLKAFEQKFIRFLNCWGRTFIQDFVSKCFNNRDDCESWDYGRRYMSREDTFLLSLILVNKRWCRYISDIVFYRLRSGSKSSVNWSVYAPPCVATADQVPKRSFFSHSADMSLSKLFNYRCGKGDRLLYSGLTF